MALLRKKRKETLGNWILSSPGTPPMNASRGFKYHLNASKVKAGPPPWHPRHQPCQFSFFLELFCQNLFSTLKPWQSNEKRGARQPKTAKQTANPNRSPFGITRSILSAANSKHHQGTNWGLAEPDRYGPDLPLTDRHACLRRFRPRRLSHRSIEHT